MCGGLCRGEMLGAMLREDFLQDECLEMWNWSGERGTLWESLAETRLHETALLSLDHTVSVCQWVYIDPQMRSSEGVLQIYGQMIEKSV